MCPDFYPVLFFDIFPKEKNGSLLASNFKDHLEEFGYRLPLAQIYFLFRRYSKEMGRLNFNGFCSIFDVSNQEYNLIEKNRFVESLTDISVGTKKLFFELIVKTAEHEQKINELKIQLLKECAELSGTLDFVFR
jgi:Ca2+-binding EF-hand superfamily protein